MIVTIASVAADSHTQLLWSMLVS